MEAPRPIEYETNKDCESIKDDEFNDKYIFMNNQYLLKIRLIEEYIYLTVSKDNEEKKYQLKLNYEEITNKIPYFKYLNHINDIFKNILQLFNTDKFSINLEGNIIKVIIKLVNIFGTEEKHELLLDEIEISEKDKINKMKNKIKELENKIIEINEDKKDMYVKIYNLIVEKNEMKIKIEDLSKENIIIKNELKNLNEKLNKILVEKGNNNIIINEKKNEVKDDLRNSYKLNKIRSKVNIFKLKQNLEYSEYIYDLLIYPKEKTNELLIYDRNNNLIKKTLKSGNIKNAENFDIFPFKSKFVNLGQSLLLTGGILGEEKLNKCYLFTIIKPKNKLEAYKLNISPYGDLKEKRERHNIIYIPSKNYVFVCSGCLTEKCEYTDISKGTWEEIKPLNKIRINGSMSFINNRYIYIFCGFNFEGEKEVYLNDLEYFDIDNFEKGWTTINYLNDKGYNLSFGTVGVIPVEKNSFLICGGYDGKEYNSKTYKIDCNDYEHPSIQDLNINSMIIFRNSSFCKIDQAYFNFDFTSNLYKFNYKNMSLGVFNGKITPKKNQE